MSNNGHHHGEWLKVAVALADADIRQFICRVESFDDLIGGEQENFVALKNVCWTEEVRIPKGSGYEVQVRVRRAEDFADGSGGDTLWVRKRDIRNVWSLKGADAFADEWAENETWPRRDVRAERTNDHD